MVYCVAVVIVYVRQIRNLLLLDDRKILVNQKVEKLTTDQGQTLRKAEVAEYLFSSVSNQEMAAAGATWRNKCSEKEEKSH